MIATNEIINGLLLNHEDVAANRLLALYDLATALDNLCICYRLNKRPSDQDLRTINRYRRYIDDV